MNFSQQLLAAALLVSSSAVEAASKKAKTSKGVKSGKSSKSSTPPVIGEAEVFHGDYDFMKNESPESVVFDSKGNAYVSLSLTAFISVLNSAGEEIARIDMPQGYCRPPSPIQVSFPLESLQFGMAMSKDDTLYVSLLACAEGFPQPPNPNLNTGLWMVDTEDYSTTLVARVPNANGRGRQDECCAWNEKYYSEGGVYGPWTEEMGHMPDGSCDVEACAFYEAWYGSAQYVDRFRGYAELWNGLEVVGECVYITNSFFHEVWHACPPETDGNTKSGKGKAGKGRRTQEDGMWDVELWMTSDASPDLERPMMTDSVTPGFNGIKYFDGSLYIANTAQGKIVKVPMVPANPNMGSKSGMVPSVDSVIRATGGRGVVPGTPELFFDFEGGDVDEFAIDVKGNIYAALWGGNKVLKISPDGISEVLLDGGPTYFCDQWQEDYEPLPTIDAPTSVAFGTNGVTNEMTLYIANSAFVFFKSCFGSPIVKPDNTTAYYPAYPGLSRIFVGEMGAEQMW